MIDIASSRAHPLVLSALSIAAIAVHTSLSYQSNSEKYGDASLALNSLQFQCCLWAVVGGSVVVCLRAVLDYTGPYLVNGKIDSAWIYESIMILAIMLPSAYLALNLNTRMAATLFWPIFHAQIIVVLNTALVFWAAKLDLRGLSPQVLLNSFMVCLTFTLHAFNPRPRWGRSLFAIDILMELSGAGMLLTAALTLRQTAQHRPDKFRLVLVDTESAQQKWAVVIMCAVLAFEVAFILMEGVFFPDTDRSALRLSYLRVAYPLLAGAALVFSLVNQRKHVYLGLKAQASLDIKRLFVRYVSHDIRTPLNTTLSRLLLLKEQLYSAKPSMDALRELLQDAHGACSISMDILNDLLMYENLDGGKLTSERAETPVWAFVQEVVKSFVVQAKSAQVELAWPRRCIDGVLSEIDQHKLSQVLRHLLSNALKFTKSGGKVRVSAEVLATTDANSSEQFSQAPGKSFRFDPVKGKDSGSGDENVYTAPPPPATLLSPRSLPEDEERGDLERGDSEKRMGDFDPHESGFGGLRGLKSEAGGSGGKGAPWTTTFEGLLSTRNKGLLRRGRKVNREYAQIVPTSTMVRISVTDSGAGISRENQQRLFREIVQFNVGRIENPTGAGVGLWLSNTLVKLHGGLLGVISHGEGQGSTFYVDLPISKIEAGSNYHYISRGDLSSASSHAFDSPASSSFSTPLRDSPFHNSPFHSPVPSNRMYISPTTSFGTRSVLELSSEKIGFESGKLFESNKLLASQKGGFDGERRVAVQRRQEELNEAFARLDSVTGTGTGSSMEGVVGGEGVEEEFGRLRSDSITSMFTTSNRSSSGRSSTRSRGSSHSRASSFNSSRGETDSSKTMEIGKVSGRSDYTTTTATNSTVPVQQLYLSLPTDGVAATSPFREAPTEDVFAFSPVLATEGNPLEPQPQPSENNSPSTPVYTSTSAALDSTPSPPQPGGRTNKISPPLPSKRFSPPAQSTIAEDSVYMGGVGQTSTRSRLLFSKRALIVDDSASNRKFVHRLLRTKIGVRDDAVNGAQAVEKAIAAMEAGTPYDVILMDYSMPIMDGPAATKLIRAAGYEGIVIGVSGNGMPQGIEVFREAGADHVLVKPISAEKFNETLTSLLLDP